jgi:hypothetical protein
MTPQAVGSPHRIGFIDTVELERLAGRLAD